MSLECSRDVTGLNFVFAYHLGTVLSSASLLSHLHFSNLEVCLRIWGGGQKSCSHVCLIFSSKIET